MAYQSRNPVYTFPTLIHLSLFLSQSSSTPDQFIYPAAFHNVDSSFALHVQSHPPFTLTFKAHSAEISFTYAQVFKFYNLKLSKSNANSLTSDLKARILTLVNELNSAYPQSNSYDSIKYSTASSRRKGTADIQTITIPRRFVSDPNSKSPTLTLNPYLDPSPAIGPPTPYSLVRYLNADFVAPWRPFVFKSSLSEFDPILYPSLNPPTQPTNFHNGTPTFRFSSVIPCPVFDYLFALIESPRPKYALFFKQLNSLSLQRCNCSAYYSLSPAPNLPQSESWKFPITCQMLNASHRPIVPYSIRTVTHRFNLMPQLGSTLTSWRPGTPDDVKAMPASSYRDVYLFSFEYQDLLMSAVPAS